MSGATAPKPIDALPSLEVMRRFWSRCEQLPNGCLRMLPKWGNPDYPKVRLGGRKVIARRVVWAINHGNTNARLYMKCGNPWCVAEEHITDQHPGLLATRGENHWNAKLRPAEVALIREGDIPVEVVAENKGIHKSTVYDIRSGRSWKGGASWD